MGSKTWKGRKIIKGKVVYFVMETRECLIKIGYTNAIKERFYNISSANPYDVILIGYIKGDEEKEKELHRRFWKYRFNKEWFYPGKELLEYAFTKTILMTADSINKKRQYVFPFDESEAAHKKFLDELEKDLLEEVI